MVGEKLPLFRPTYYCPNADCSFEKPLKQGVKCPQCGAEAKPFGMREGAALFATKKTGKIAVARNTGDDGKSGYFCPNPECTNVTELRQGDKCPVCGSEAQSDEIPEANSPARSRGDAEGVLFTEATTEEEIVNKIRLSLERLRGMDEESAIHEQNKVIILQNELILRKLRREK